MHLLPWFLTLLLIVIGLMVVRITLGRRTRNTSKRLPTAELERCEQRTTGLSGGTLDGQASMLGEHLRPSSPVTLRDPAAVEALVRAGDIDGAMAAYCEQTATSKLEARLAVERIRLGIGR